MNSCQSQFGIVITTIGQGEFFEVYRALFDEKFLAERLHFYVIADRKTPQSLFEAASRAEAAGMNVTCPDLDAQIDLLSSWGAAELIPFDSDNRRNIGYVLAWLDGCDPIISLDDDNVPVGSDFFDEHEIAAAGPTPIRLVDSTTGWFNCCDLLEAEPIPVYPRGFPFRARVASQLTYRNEETIVAANAGLWLGDPDVDAITRLGAAPAITAGINEDLGLGPATWCPVNTQNTAVRRAAIPSYYFVRMGYEINGLSVDRFGDIFSGLYLQACAKHLGHTIRFGRPYVQHARNEHNLLQDLVQELPAILVLEELSAWLQEHPLEGGTYEEAYLALTHGLDDAAEQFSGQVWSEQARGFVHQMAHLMRSWLRLLERAGNA